MVAMCTGLTFPWQIGCSFGIIQVVMVVYFVLGQGPQTRCRGNEFLCQAPYLIYVLPGSIQTSLRFIKVTISIVRKFVGRKCHYDQLAFQEQEKRVAKLAQD